MICVTEIESCWHWEIIVQRLRMGFISSEWHIHKTDIKLVTRQSPYHHQRETSTCKVKHPILSFTTKIDQTTQIPKMPFSLYYFKGPGYFCSKTRQIIVPRSFPWMDKVTPVFMIQIHHQGSGRSQAVPVLSEPLGCMATHTAVPSRSITAMLMSIWGSQKTHSLIRNKIALLSVSPCVRQSGYLKCLIADRDLGLTFGTRNPHGGVLSNWWTIRCKDSFKVLIKLELSAIECNEHLQLDNKK